MTCEIKHIQKRYGRRTVLRDVTLSCGRGEAIALVGANGSGKSTLLRSLAGILKPDGGELLWEGTDLLRSRSALEQTVTYVPQGTPLMEELTALDNLRLWYDAKSLSASLDDGMLRQLGIGDFLKVRASRLSGGMRKRLSIACAIAKDPQLLLLDEPTAALDLAAQAKLAEYFHIHLNRGGIILLATHDVNDIAMASRCLLLKDGCVEPYTYSGDIHALARDLEKP